MTDTLLSFSVNEALVLGAFVAAGILLLFRSMLTKPVGHSLSFGLVDLVQLVRISDDEHEVWIRTKSGLIINYIITREVFNQIVDRIDNERINDITT